MWFIYLQLIIDVINSIVMQFTYKGAAEKGSIGTELEDRQSATRYQRQELVHTVSVGFTHEISYNKWIQDSLYPC